MIFSECGIGDLLWDGMEHKMLFELGWMGLLLVLKDPVCSDWKGECRDKVRVEWRYWSFSSKSCGVEQY